MTELNTKNRISEILANIWDGKAKPTNQRKSSFLLKERSGGVVGGGERRAVSHFSGGLVQWAFPVLGHDCILSSSLHFFP